MLIPRASRLLLTALVLVANLATPDLVCAQHEEHEAVTGTGGADVPMHHGEHLPAPDDPPEKHSPPPICCPAVMSCSISVLARTDTVPALDGAAGIPSAAYPQRHFPPGTPPDPPPPKS